MFDSDQFYLFFFHSGKLKCRLRLFTDKHPSTANISTCIRVSVPQLISKSVPKVRIIAAAADATACPFPLTIRSASSLHPTHVL